MGMRDKYKDHGAGGVNLGLIITPMLDMSFQILSFFIMTYHPSALEGHIPGSLAPPDLTASKGKENQTPETVPLSVPEDMILPEIQEALTVIVKTGGLNPGQPDKLQIKRKTAPTPEQIADATMNWTQAKMELGRTLKQFGVEAGGEKTNIKIEADGDLRQEYVMAVYDVCKQSGFSKIHFVPPPIIRAGKD